MGDRQIEREQENERVSKRVNKETNSEQGLMEREINSLQEALRISCSNPSDAHRVNHSGVLKENKLSCYASEK